MVLNKQNVQRACVQNILTKMPSDVSYTKAMWLALLLQYVSAFSKQFYLRAGIEEIIQVIMQTTKKLLRWKKGQAQGEMHER